MLCKVAICALALLSVATSMPRVRHPAPDFSGQAVFPDFSFRDVSLRNFTSNGQWLLLLTYPADFTFVCPTELLAFSDRHSEFASRGVNVVFMSVDNKHSHLAWLRTPRKAGGLGRIKFPLIGDVTKEISAAYGVLIDDTSEDRGLALRSTFIIDPDGILRHSASNDLPVGRSVDEYLRLVDGFQFSRTHPDLGCPANWKKGDKNIKTDPVGAKEYFASLSDDL